MKEYIEVIMVAYLDLHVCDLIVVDDLQYL